jgi:cytochrome c556
MTFRLNRLAVALVATLGVTAAFAAGTADDLINARQAEMKVNGKALQGLVDILRGVTPYDAAVVKTNLDALAASQKAQADGKLWDASSQTGATVETRALPAIWQNADGFAKAQQGLTDAIAAVGASTDMASFKAAFTAIGAACKSCHEQFRGG